MKFTQLQKDLAYERFKASNAFPVKTNGNELDEKYGRQIFDFIVEQLEVSAIESIEI